MLLERTQVKSTGTRIARDESTLLEYYSDNCYKSRLTGRLLLFSQSHPAPALPDSKSLADPPQPQRGQATRRCSGGVLHGLRATPDQLAATRPR